MLNNYKNTVTERFLKYVQIDTQSNADSQSQPSTKKQLRLSRILVKELQQMGIVDAELDAFGYVYATLPANTPKENVPTICFCAHVDTSPDCSGKDVKPIVHQQWNGYDIALPDDPSQVLSIQKYPELKSQIGHDLITARGLTLLGADDKAGVAEIMDAMNHLINTPQIKHGTIRLLFTPDEEIGRGTAKIDLKKLNAHVGYTLDGGRVGSLENETFSANAVKITIFGVSTHPGYAKNKMENALKIAAKIVDKLPKNKLSPETTHKREGFIHPTALHGTVEQATIEFIVRDFSSHKLNEKHLLLQKIMNKVIAKHEPATASFEVSEQYRNMKEIIDQHPNTIYYAALAMKKSNIKPDIQPIRGGTDGSRLSFMGLPCPNLFAGEQLIHSRHECVSVQDMEKAVEVIVNLCQIYEENPNKG